MKIDGTIEIVPKKRGAYMIDFDKVKSMRDVKRILRALRIEFRPPCPSMLDIADLLYFEDYGKR